MTLKSAVTTRGELAVGALFTSILPRSDDRGRDPEHVDDARPGQPHDLFGPQQTISDADTCSPLQITRQGIRNPPTTSVFSALTALLSRRTTAFRLG